MMVIQLFVLTLVAAGILNLEYLVAITDGFFIGNALIGTAAAFVLFKAPWIKYGSVVLSLFFLAVLVHSNIYVLLFIATSALYCVFVKKRKVRTLKKAHS